MYPISSDIFGRLNWLVKKIKQILFKLTKIEQSGAGSYKVYTAFLTQSGGDDVNTTNSGLLEVGKTYEIFDYQPGDDFTNVGAPSNTNTLRFVATGAIPAVWTNGSYLAFNNGAPVVTVLENTIGNIWFTYDNVGVYSIYSNDLFTDKKTIPSFENIFNNGWEKNIWADMEESTNSRIKMLSYNTSIPGFENYLDLCKIEIRIYN